MARQMIGRSKPGAEQRETVDGLLVTPDLAAVLAHIAALEAALAAVLAAAPLLVATVRLTDAQIKAGTSVVVAAAVVGSYLVPLAMHGIFDASGGAYAPNPSLFINYQGSATNLLSIGSMASGATKRVGFGVPTSAPVFTTTTFDPLSKALTARCASASTGGNAANYCDTTVWYLQIGNPAP